MAKGVPQLRISRFLTAPSQFHIARRVWSRGHRLPLHTHDFPELFWLERGCATHLINGQRQRLAAGDLVLVRPADCHSYALTSTSAKGTAKATGFTFVNIAFPQQTLDHIEHRYFRDQIFPWRGNAKDANLPATFHLRSRQTRQLSTLADSLAVGGQSRLQFEAFLLTLLQMVTPPHDSASLARPSANASSATRSQPLEAPPPWLREAIARFDAPAHLTGGPAELARLAGYCPEHVNRVVRRCFGKRTTDLINDLRLDHAARRLRMSDEGITQIAMDCGLSHLGHFYKLFNARFGSTPHRYRRSERHPV